MDLSYPQVGFHFSVIFELFPQFPNDIRFQEVSGLSAEVETESVNEGGENRFAHHLPSRTKYSDLVLKRGKFLGSGVLHWCRKAIEFQEYHPSNLIISLLDENHLPVYNWYVVNAIPVKLDISSFNAEQNSIVIETMTLKYQYFKYYDPVSTSMDLVGGLTASASINIGF